MTDFLLSFHPVTQAFLATCFTWGLTALGAAAVVAFVLIAMTIIFKLIDKFTGLRVSREEELKGLDITEHGMEAYAGFQIFTTQ